MAGGKGGGNFGASGGTGDTGEAGSAFGGGGAAGGGIGSNGAPPRVAAQEAWALAGPMARPAEPEVPAERLCRPTARPGGNGTNVAFINGTITYVDSGGGGGGGGFNGYTGSGVLLTSPSFSITGGSGGAGGTGYGAGGGAGGYGAAVSGTQVTNAASVTGGAGGAGGGDVRSIFSTGSGGDGGVGLATASGANVTNTGSATGGAGGVGYTGGGGGGGITVAAAGALSNSGHVTGGAGGGGFSVAGIGGAGVEVAGASSVINNTSGTIKGGIGGGQTNASVGLSGAGVSFAASGGTLTNAGAITGGAGFSGGNTSAAGAAGVSGSGLTIVDTGAIAGGTGGTSGSGAAGAQGDAITLTSGANTLALGANAGMVGTGGLSGALDIQAGTLTFDQSKGAALPANVTLAAPIIGAGAVVKAGTGTLTLSGDNTYTGGLTIAAGTVSVSTANNLGASSGPGITFTGGTLETTASVTSQFKMALITAGTLQVDAGTLSQSGLVSGTGTLAKTGTGTLTLVDAANSYSGGTTVPAGTLDLAAAGAAGGGAITFAGTSGSTATLALDTATQPANNATFANTLATFGANDQLDLKGLNYKGAATTQETYTSSTGVLMVAEGGKTEDFTLSGVVPGETFFAESDGNGGTLVVATVCYASGSRIRTERGDVAVEDLAVGDRVVTTSGALRPIRWLGHRRVRCGSHPRPEKVWPYRVKAGAFGAGLPYRDLYLSPAHALCVDDLLIPVRALRHGDLVTQVEVEEVTYWHVELNSHDILLANGLPAESYLDIDNRASFDNADGPRLLHPDFEPLSTADYCRPYVESGPALTRVRAKLFGADQALPDQTGGLHLVADGTVLLPHISGGAATFVVPALTVELCLRSPSFRNLGDARDLGIAISALAIDTGVARRDIALDHPALFAGVHDVEGSGDGRWRWTDGNAHLAASLWADATGAFLLRVTGILDAAAQPAEEVDARAA